MNIASLVHDNVMNIVSLSLGFVSIVITAFIAFQQRKQLNHAVNIGNETKSITATLATDSFVADRASKLFPLSRKYQGTHNRYKIVYPVHYLSGKPLPLINQGDFYAIHVIGMALGLDKVSLKEIDTSKGSVKVEDDWVTGNVIFICSPQSNPALNKKFSYVATHSDDNRAWKGKSKKRKSHKEKRCNSEDDIKKWLKKMNLPCWFVNDYQSIDDIKVRRKDDKVTSEQYDRTPIKKIQVYDAHEQGQKLDEPLESNAEHCYRRKRNGVGNVPYGKAGDYGIFARLTEGDNRYIIIAGLHQYGTWIVADYVNRVLRFNEDKLGTLEAEYMRAFTSDSDFMAVIEGEFDSSSMSVESPRVYGNKLWVRSKGEKWIRHRKLDLTC